MKNKLVYFLFATWMVWGGTACEDKTFDEFVSGTGDYTSETGGDYYEGEGIDVSHYDKARTFPGLVDTLTERRLDEATLAIDMSLPAVDKSKVGLAYTPLAVYSTGLYAGAGEKVTIVLDEDVKGLTVQIGIHNTDLSSLTDTYLGRDPKIVTSMPLFQGSNEIRNPYGGYIWIKRNGDAIQRNVSLKVQGVYAAPDFVSGETGSKKDEWMNAIRETTVPWVELRGKNIVFSVPASYMKLKIQMLGDAFPTQLQQALDMWDDWVKCYLEFYGLDGASESFPMSGFPVREVMDTHLSTERYSYYGNTNVNLLSTEELINVITDPEEIKKTTLNTGHVVGWLQASMLKQTYFPSKYPNNFKEMFALLPNYYFLYKNNWWGQSDQIEVPSFYDGDKVIKRNTYVLKSSAFDHLVSWAAADSCKIYSDEAGRPVKEDYGSEQSWPSTLFICSSILQYKQEAEQKDGWKYFAYLNRFLLEDSQKSIGQMNLQDAMLKCLTDYFERDFSQLFDRVGIEVSDIIRQEALDKPYVEKCIWMFNPLKRNEPVADFDGKVFQTKAGTGYTPNRHLRTEWEAVAYSKDWKHNNYNWKDKKTPYALFDGDRGTMWESYYDRYQTYTENGYTYQAFYGDKIYYKAQTPELPYSIVIQPGETSLPVLDGIYMAAGYRLSNSVYSSDVKTATGKDWGQYSFRPQRIRVHVTHDPLEYHYQDSTFVSVENINWTLVYDSDNEKALSPDKKQFWPDRYNMFYVEFDKRYTNVTGIRLEIPEVSHEEPDRPDFLTEDKFPGRPLAPNKNLERIHMFGEFGTYYYKEDR